MTKCKKTYRLDADLVESLQAEADRRGITATDAVEAAIRAYVQVPDAEPDEMPDASHTEHDSALLDVLARQLDTKDEQIRELTKALLNAQEQGKAAQVLQAAEKNASTLLGGSDSKEDDRRGFFGRLFGGRRE